MMDFSRESMEEYAMRILKEEKLVQAAEQMIREDLHTVAIENPNDGWFAGAVECRCEEKSCPLVKSGYIFETDKEALQYAMMAKRNLRKELIEDIRRGKV